MEGNLTGCFIPSLSRSFNPAVKIRNTPEASVKRQPKARRLFGMTSKSLCSTGIASTSVDKENGSSALSSPNAYISTPRKTIARKPVKILRWNPLEDCDSNSQGSGYSVNHLSDSMQMLSNGIGNLLAGHIVSPSEKPMERKVAMTPGFAKSKPTAMRRLFSFNNTRIENSETPPMSKARSRRSRSSKVSSFACKLTFEEKSPRGSVLPVNSPLARTLKRSEPPTDARPVPVKRSRTSRSVHQEIPEVDAPSPTTTKLQRNCSETDARTPIESVICRSTTDAADLIGDFSKPCILPLTKGCHEDLKSISSETLAGLIRGDFKDCISSFTIVDCRYPFEYDGGHIDGAVNLYTEDLIERRLLNPIMRNPEIQPDTDKRKILVFHCEFSWERGPNLSRFLRNMDRQRNMEYYPALHYPEVYLLHGGYRRFFRTQKALCSPQTYKPMKHPNHEVHLRQFRGKSKSWPAEKVQWNGFAARVNSKQLCF